MQVLLTVPCGREGGVVPVVQPVASSAGLRYVAVGEMPSLRLRRQRALQRVRLEGAGVATSYAATGLLLWPFDP